MDTNIKCLIIRCNNSLELTTIPQDKLGEFVSKVVSYNDYELFERVQFYTMNSQMWCNEGALLFENPPVNPIASLMCLSQHIYCDVVLTGLDDSYSGDVKTLNGKSLEFANKLISLCDSEGVIDLEDVKDVLKMYSFRMFN